MTRQLVNKANKEIHLDTSFTKRGGEGRVTLIKNSRRLYPYEAVVKEYFKPPTKEKRDKISYMVSIDARPLLEVTAWPIDAVFEKRTRKFVGYIMPYTASREPIHNLYTPSSRMNHFPNSNWKFLLVVAINVARAFSKVHGKGHLIGDVNHSNILVGGNSKVVLIDTDSFQIKSPRRTFLCDVGVKDYLPPELFGKTLNMVVRTQNHDNFSLAIILFQLLFLGRHPFMGRMTNGEDVSLEASVERLLYAFSFNARSQNVQPPPPHLSFQASDLPPYISDLFERAFSKKTTTSGRPSAKDWAVALDQLRLSLKVCNKNKNHHHSPNNSCAFCRLDTERARKNKKPIFGSPNKRGGAPFFPVIKPKKQQGSPANKLAPEAEFNDLTGVIGPQRYQTRLKEAGLVSVGILILSGLLNFSPLLLGLLGPAVWIGIASIQRAQSLNLDSNTAWWMLIPPVNIGMAIYFSIAERKK